MNEPLIDLPTFTALQEAAGAEFVRELVDTFIEEAPLMLAELRSAQASGAADAFRRAAHSLKSNSTTFGATRLAEIARGLEQGGLIAESGPLGALEAEFQRAAAALKTLCNG